MTKRSVFPLVCTQALLAVATAGAIAAPPVNDDCTTTDGFVNVADLLLALVSWTS